jgi:hypothetical protein
VTDQSNGRDRFGDEPAPTDDEIREAEQLRVQLEHDPLVRALRAAHAPEAIASDRHRKLLERVLDTPKARARNRSAIVRLGPAAAGILALAAAAALVFRQARMGETQSAETASITPTGSPSYALSRSASALIAADPTNEPSRSSERVDRIAYARARDFRDNRFESWGVR